MLASLIAERYSKALLRAALAENALDEVGGETEILRSALEGAAEAASFLGDPVAQASEKLRVLTGVFDGGGHPIVRGFLSTVLDHKRERFLPAILKAFAGLRDEAQGRVKATFTTARDLPVKEKELLQAALSRRLDRSVVLLPFTDRNLLGGAVLKIGDRVFDGSVQSGLLRLGRLLNEAPGARSLKPVRPQVEKAQERSAPKAVSTAIPPKNKKSPMSPVKVSKAAPPKAPVAKKSGGKNASAPAAKTTAPRAPAKTKKRAPSKKKSAKKSKP